MRLHKMPAMPLRRELAARYADALGALASATHRTATVVNIGGRYALRVELEYGRFVLAANTVEGLSRDPDAAGTWYVRICSGAEEDPTVLADAHGDWVIDAFDDAYSALRQSAHWIASDIQRGALG